MSEHPLETPPALAEDANSEMEPEMQLTEEAAAAAAEASPATLYEPAVNGVTPSASGDEPEPDVNMVDVPADRYAELDPEQPASPLALTSAMPTPLGGNAAWSTPGFGGAQTPIATGTTTTTTTTTAGGGIPTSNSNEASPLPSSRTDTPPAARNNNMTDGNGNDSGARTGGTGSRAASVHPADAGAAATTLFTMPTEAPVHGAPVRQYINTKITGALLEGMKLVAKEQPENPLRMLGEFLLQRSKETEEPIAF